MTWSPDRDRDDHGAGSLSCSARSRLSGKDLWFEYEGQRDHRAWGWVPAKVSALDQRQLRAFSSLRDGSLRFSENSSGASLSPRRREGQLSPVAVVVLGGVVVDVPHCHVVHLGIARLVQKAARRAVLDVVMATP